MQRRVFGKSFYLCWLHGDGVYEGVVLEGRAPFSWQHHSENAPTCVQKADGRMNAVFA